MQPYVKIEIKQCLICGDEFIPKSSEHKYCSKKCRSIIQLAKRSKKPKYKKCKLCNTEFKPYTSLDKFCSANCRIESMKSKRDQRRRWNKDSVKKRHGKNNPGYRNGNYVRGKKREFSRVFQNNVNALKAEMIKDVGYVYCQYCLTSQSLRFEGHHIIYRSEKPGHKHLHSKENTILLCIKCHNIFHKCKGNRNDIVEERGLDKLFGIDILNK